MSQFNIISAAAESTVVAEYTPDACRSDSYQSEAALEQEFLRLLYAQGYEYLEIHDEAALIANLRRQLEGLNNYAFSDSEWTRFFKDCIAGANDGILEKTRRIQLDHVQVLRQDSGASKNIYLLDKKHIHNNTRASISTFIRRTARKRMETKKTSTMILPSRSSSSGRWRSTSTTF